MADMKPRDLVDKGLIDELSMTDYTVDREAVQRALDIELSQPQQGGVGAIRPSQHLQHPAPQQPFGGKPVSGWQNPWGKNG